MKGVLNGSAAKFVMALVGAAATLLSHFSSSWWEPTAAAVVIALGVYLVPNSAAPAQVAKDKPGPPAA